MSSVLRERLRSAIAPPHYLLPSLAGIDISTSGIKAARIAEGRHGLILAGYADARLPSGAYVDGEIVDPKVVAEVLSTVARAAGVSVANVALSESKSYLFEAEVSGSSRSERRIAIEQRLDELVPLPPPETIFDFVEVGKGRSGGTRVAGVGLARRIVDVLLSVFDTARIGVQSLEGELFASARALLPRGDESTTLIIDVGRSTTKIAVVVGHVPYFATTIGIGGHALTLAVQKHFGVTEAEARRIKEERGIVPAPGNEDYLAVMLSTVSAIRDEIARWLVYWQDKATAGGVHAPVAHAILVGGNASVRGFPEYLEGGLKIPVAVGNVYSNFASHDEWIPDLDFTEALAYPTVVGLALRDTPLLYG